MHREHVFLELHGASEYFNSSRFPFWFNFTDVNAVTVTVM